MYTTAEEGGPPPPGAGWLRRLRLWLARRRPDADDIIAHRVRAVLNGVSEHPGALRVCVRHGNVTLRGVAVAGEEAGLLARASQVRGVISVRSRLELHVDGEIPAMNERAAHRRLMLHPTWAAYVGITLLGLGAAVAGVLGLRGRRSRGSTWLRRLGC